ncbi:hypothetical protein QFZ49_007277 [Streptomyces turgidiscabies]|uniref:Uncharacterized protein n=1 Tax=Streptomyces turgidiscabies TaxID=85558 RepID=A0ABU0RZ80_9ACTN|nr:hypothetical protein [Streptomyces turgidiscabies]
MRRSLPRYTGAGIHPDPEGPGTLPEGKVDDCRWYLELDWSSQGRAGTVRVDDAGRPFRTSAIKGLPRYVYSMREWVPRTD